MSTKISTGSDIPSPDRSKEASLVGGHHAATRAFWGTAAVSPWAKHGLQGTQAREDVEQGPCFPLWAEMMKQALLESQGG